MPNKVKVSFSVPTPSPILYPIATIAMSTNTDAAKKFIEFVMSPTAQGVLAKYGFGKA